MRHNPFPFLSKILYTHLFFGTYKPLCRYIHAKHQFVTKNPAIAPVMKSKKLYNIGMSYLYSFFMLFYLSSGKTAFKTIPAKAPTAMPERLIVMPPIWNAIAPAAL